MRRIRSRAVAVTIRCDWMRRTTTMGSHFSAT
jgi:hypothetical protein